MSLLILIILIAFGHIIINVERIYDRSTGYLEQKIAGFTIKLFIIYISVLFIGIIGSIGSGVIYWLKNGVWFTASPNYFIYNLEKTNLIREILLYKSSWVGLENISSWYLQQNIAWSFFATIIVLLFHAYLALNDPYEQNT